MLNVRMCSSLYFFISLSIFIVTFSISANNTATVKGLLSVNDEIVGNSLTIAPFTTAGIVHNNASGLLSSSLIVNADVDPAAAIVDTKLATISTAGKVANSATTATSANTASAIIARDASGNFSAGTITANLSGNATTATTATNFSGSLSGDVTGTQSATVVSTVGGQTAANVAAATVLANAATNLNTANTLVLRDNTGSFSAQIVSVVDSVVSRNIIIGTSSIIMQATNKFIHTAGSGNTFVGVSAGTNATISSTSNVGVGGSALVNLTNGTDNIAVGFNALSTNTTGNSNSALGRSALTQNTTGINNTAVGASSLQRNTVGNNNTAVGYQALNANTTGINNIAIGYQSGQVLTTGSGNVYINANAAIAAENTTTRIGTSQTQCFIAGISGVVPTTATPVVINSSGQLGSSSTISVTDVVASGNLVLTTNPSTSTAGNIMKGSSSFIHNTGTSNTFIGITAGNFTTSGTGQNSALGTNALVANTTGANNVACGYNSLNGCTTGSSNISIGSGAGATLTTGSNNIYIGSSAGSASESNTIRIGTFGTQTACYLQGLVGLAVSLSTVVVDSTTGKLGYLLSSAKFKDNIADMNDSSANILKLRPVTFVYKNDETKTQQFGLIAEEVDKIFPAIVVNDENGDPKTVQYHVLPVLLLNEMKKQQKIIEEMKQNYVTKEEINIAIDNLQAELQLFIINILKNYFLHDIKKDSC